MADRPVGRQRALKELGEVLWLSFPIIITMTSNTAMQFVDAMMLGRFGEAELAAVSPAGMTFFIFAAFILGVNGCNNTFVSQSLGRGQLHDCGRYTIHAIYLALLAQPLMIPLIAAAHPLFSLFPHKPEVIAREVAYFRPLALRLGATGMMVALATFFQATSRPVIPMITGITANSLNVLGNYALIFGHFGLPRWGIFGAALATTVSGYVEVLMLLGVFLLPANRGRYGTSHWWPVDFRRIWQLLRIGLGAGVTFALDVASWSVFINALVGRLGTAYLAASTASSQIMRLSFMPTIGLNIGVTALVGRHIGRQDIPGAKRRAYLGMAAAASYMTLMAAIVVTFRGPLMQLFNDTPDVIRAGSVILLYAALFQFSDAIGILSGGALRGAGDTRFPAIVNSAVAFLFFLPLASVLGRPQVWGLHGCWIAATLYIWIIDVILFWRFASERWRKINIFK